MYFEYGKPLWGHQRLVLNRECCARYTPTALSLLIFCMDLERGAGAEEDRTVLCSRRACGDLVYSTLRDSMRADAYAGGRIKNIDHIH